MERLRELIDALDNTRAAEITAQLKSITEALAEPMPQPALPRPPSASSARRANRNAGRDGADGRDGIDGVNVKGDEGPHGRDGISIIATAINRDGELILTLSDGTLLTPAAWCLTRNGNKPQFRIARKAIEGKGRRDQVPTSATSQR